MQFVISFVLTVVLISPAFAQQFSIDSPLPNSVQSGTVAPPNGWICPRNGEITARIDGGPVIDFFEDLSRGDTAEPCGNSGNNAFGTLPWNWNIFGDGAHSIEFFEAGVKFAGVSFSVVTFGAEFLSGPMASVTVEDFPDPGADVTVSWDTAIQNFRLSQSIEEPGSIHAGLYTGVSSQGTECVIDFNPDSLCHVRFYIAPTLDMLSASPQVCLGAGCPTDSALLVYTHCGNVLHIFGTPGPISVVDGSWAYSTDGFEIVADCEGDTCHGTLIDDTCDTGIVHWTATASGE